MPQDPLEHSAVWRYGIAVLTVALAVLVTLASREFGLGNRSAAFLAAVLLTGWYAGTGPLVLALVLSVFTYDYFFLPPLYTFGPSLSSDPYLAWFLVFALLAAWFSTARRRSARLLEQARDELEERVAARTAELLNHAQLLNLTHDTIFVRDMSDAITYWNRGAELLYGWSRDEAVGQVSHRLTQTVFPAPLDEINEQLLRTGRWEGELVHTKRDGTRVVVASRWSLQRDALGKPTVILETNNDITERKRAQRALRRAREHALKAQFAAVLEERTRLAREMHDTLLQGFTGIGLKLVAAANLVTGPPETTAALSDVITVAQKTLTEARRAVWGLRAATLTGSDFSAGLRNAAEDCVRGTSVSLEYDVRGPPRPVDPDVEAVVIRVAQEAIANVVKHANAQTVRVTLSFGARRVRLSVKDDGRGFEVASDFHAYDGHWGLLGMQERAGQIHGKFSVQSIPGHGAHIVLLVPYSVSPASSPVSSPAR